MMRTPILALAAFALAAPVVHAQITLNAAVDAALRTSPRIKMSEAELAKARGSLNESRDVFIPAISVGAGLGQSYGYSPNPPTLVTMQATSLIYSASQFPYIHSARAGYNAARRSLDDVREAVAEDAVLTYLAVVHDQQREEILTQQAAYATRLVAIVEDRFNAGHDSRMDLTQARLTAAQLKLSRLRAQDETEIDRTHLGRLTGLPQTAMRADDTFPATPLKEPAALDDRYANSAVAAAFMTAHAKQQQAVGDAKYLFRPQIGLSAQYNRYATFTDSFKNLKLQQDNLSANEEVFGVQITIPLFDRLRRDKNNESAAEASRSLHEAEYAQMQALDGQTKLNHTIDELEARADVAALEQQVSQQQLEIIQLQLTAPVNGAPALTPKDEQNARIAERDKYLGVVDTTFQLHQAQVSLLRQTGHLLDWMTRSGLAVPPPPPAPTLKRP